MQQEHATSAEIGDPAPDQEGTAIRATSHPAAVARVLTRFADYLRLQLDRAEDRARWNAGGDVDLRLSGRTVSNLREFLVGAERLAALAAGEHPPTADYAGSDAGRQRAGLPGHCEQCAAVGHVLSHPDLNCRAVGCGQYTCPNRSDPAGAALALGVLLAESPAALDAAAAAFARADSRPAAIRNPVQIRHAAAAMLRTLDPVTADLLRDLLSRAEQAKTRAARSAATCGGCRDSAFRHNLACDIVRALNGEEITR